MTDNKQSLENMLSGTSFVLDKQPEEYNVQEDFSTDLHQFKSKLVRPQN